MEIETTEISQMIQELNQFIVPSSLMESFDAYREESVKKAVRGFSAAQLAWFLDMMNRYRGPEDRKESLVDMFDPGMFTCDHPAWRLAPGTQIEMPALTSEVAKLVDRSSEFAEIAREEINDLRHHAETYSDEEIIGLARIAAAALVDRQRSFIERAEAIDYLALNASALLEDLWTTDDTLWADAPHRLILFEDMVARRKADLLGAHTIYPRFVEQDLVCFTEDEIRRFAFDIRSLFMTDRAKHVAVCTQCQTRLEIWTKMVAKFDECTPALNARADA